MNQKELTSYLIGLALVIDRLRVTGRGHQAFGKKAVRFSAENLDAIITKLEIIKEGLCKLIPESEVKLDA